MAPRCQDKCRHEKKVNTQSRPYTLGYKRFTICDVYIKTTVLKCYCCNIRLRGKSLKYKKKVLG